MNKRKRSYKTCEAPECLGKVLHGLRNTEMLPGLLCMKQLFYDGCNEETVVLS